MSADSRIYSSDRMAAAYAFTRPPVHPQIIARVARLLGTSSSVDVALDVGCGAGASTAALAPIARRAVGIEPYPSMLRHSSAVAPRATFVAGRAEALPFPDGSFDMATTAGALNYADVEISLSEISRVLLPGSLFVAYDFSAGRRLRNDSRLGGWHDAFLARFPSPPGYALDLRQLNYSGHALTFGGHEALEVAVPMSLDAYVSYMLGEAGVERAMAAGRTEADIRRETEDGLRAIFGDGRRDVIFDAEIAWATRE